MDGRGGGERGRVGEWGARREEGGGGEVGGSRGRGEERSKGGGGGGGVGEVGWWEGKASVGLAGLQRPHLC